MSVFKSKTRTEAAARKTMVRRTKVPVRKLLPLGLKSIAGQAVVGAILRGGSSGSGLGDGISGVFIHVLGRGRT
jgi:hypothetical protein